MTVPIAVPITTSVPITISIAIAICRSRRGGSGRWLVCDRMRPRLWQALIKCIVPVVAFITLGLRLVVPRRVTRYTAILNKAPVVATGGTGDTFWRKRGTSYSPVGQTTLFILPPLLIQYAI